MMVSYWSEVMWCKAKQSAMYEMRKSCWRAGNKSFYSSHVVSSTWNLWKQSSSIFHVLCRQIARFSHFVMNSNIFWLFPFSHFALPKIYCHRVVFWLWLANTRASCLFKLIEWLELIANSRRVISYMYTMHEGKLLLKIKIIYFLASRRKKYIENCLLVLTWITTDNWDSQL